MVTTIRVISGTDVLEAEQLVLKSMCMSYMRLGCQAELPIVSIYSIWVEDGEAMHIIGLRLHKATKANRFRGKMWEIIKGVSRDNVGEVRNNSGER
jgi:hypothetical protein